MHKRELWIALCLGCVSPVGSSDGDRVLPPDDPAPPPPIVGGTLATSKVIPNVAWLASPDRDAVDVVRMDVWKAGAHFDLPTGSEPGRMVEDPGGRMHVVLRGGGAIATLDAVAQTTLFHPVCPSPRGITATPTQLVVACETGELVFTGFDGAITSTVVIGRDLRDVVVDSQGHLWVSRFRSASLIELGASGEFLRELGPARITLGASSIDGGGTAGGEDFEPHVAWRTIIGADDTIYMLHQLDTERALPTHESQVVVTSPPYYSGSGTSCANTPVITAVTRFRPGMKPQTILIPASGPAIDLALDNSRLAIAGGGAFNASAVLVDIEAFDFYAVDVFTTRCPPVRDLFIRDPVNSVAFAADGNVFVQTRGDAAMRKYQIDAFNEHRGEQPRPAFAVSITPTRQSAGREIFQAPTHLGIACASCHPEGGDDGYTWNFKLSTHDIKRRTPALRGGLIATAPFHWEGDLDTMGALTKEVYGVRMDGHALDDNELASLTRWLDALPALPRPRLDPASVQRGAHAFATSGCTACHSGHKLTNNVTMDVGTGGSFQVPSLVGVGSRAPYMHDGCASTLMVRLRDPACGGSKHGDTSALSSADFLDLEAYLQSL